MPARYEIDEDLETAFSYYWGVLTLDEVIGIVRERRDDPRFRPHFRSLVDCSGTTANLRFDDTSKLAEFTKSGAVPQMTGRTALYISQRNAVYGTLRQLQVMLGPEDKVQVFTDLAEARAWLGLPPK